MELNKIQHSKFSLTCTDQTVIVKVVEPSLVNRIISNNEGGGKTAPGPSGDQGLLIRLVDCVCHPVVEVEDVPDGDICPTPTWTKRSCLWDWSQIILKVFVLIKIFIIIYFTICEQFLVVKIVF